MPSMPRLWFRFPALFKKNKGWGRGREEKRRTKGRQDKKKPWKSWRYGSVVKNTYFSSTGPELHRTLFLTQQ